MSKEERGVIDTLLRRLLWLGIAVFLLISAFDIHRWRRDNWQAFDALFAADASQVFGQGTQPIWLYAVAFPFVAVNFGCMVLMLRGHRRHILPAFLVSAAAIAAMPLAAGQMVIYRIIWPDILTALGYAIGGAIALIIGLGLDSVSAAARSPRQTKD